MCLGVPARVIEIYVREGLRVARVAMGGVEREVLLVTSEDISPGDYVIVHAGMAISKIKEDELDEILSLWRELEEALTGRIAP